MPEKKNQHFVAKAHLKFFASDAKKRQINIWLPEDDKVVFGASISDQCSKSYFYGKDLKIEDYLSSPEALFSATVAQLAEQQNARSEQLQDLLFYWLIQYTRVEKTLREQIKMTSEMTQKIMLGQEDNEQLRDWIGDPIGEPEFMQTILDDAHFFLETIRDLRCVLLINNSRTNFVMSDCPAVFSNELYLMRYMKYRNWGLGSAGVYLYMPLTPRLGFLAYDQDVYELQGRKGNVCQLKDRDAVILNQLIFLFSNKVIILPPDNDSSIAVEPLKNVASDKPANAFRVNIALADEMESTNGSQRFTVVSNNDYAASSRDRLIHVESLPVVVPCHFSKLRIRHKPRFIDTHSGAGLRRCAGNYQHL